MYIYESACARIKAFVFNGKGKYEMNRKELVTRVSEKTGLMKKDVEAVPLTGTSVNPARSLAPAIFMGGRAIEQVWLFIAAPLVGAALLRLYGYFS